MKKFRGNMLVHDFRETYHMRGEYTFKIVLNPERFKSCHDARVVMYDPERQPMDLFIDRWGRKMKCTFIIDDRVSDGVCVVKIDLKDKGGGNVEEILHCWVIK